MVDRRNDGPNVQHLARYVELEARRRFIDPQAPADPALVAAGWMRRFITDIRRVPELLELYEQLGYEARAEPLRPDELGDDCRDCQLAALSFRSVYTRRPDVAKSEEQDGEKQ